MSVRDKIQAAIDVSSQESAIDGESLDSDDTPDEVIIEGIREGLQQALTGDVLPLSEIENTLQHPINKFSGKIDAFKGINGVAFQRENR